MCIVLKVVIPVSKGMKRNNVIGHVISGNSSEKFHCGNVVYMYY